MCKVYTDVGGIKQLYHVCPPVRKIIHSLKLVDYLHVQADNPWYNYFWAVHFAAFCSNCILVSLFSNFLLATTRDFQQFDILTSEDSDKPLQPPFKLRNSIWCSVRSLTIIEYSSD